jgi:hypothetical protein
VRFAGASSADGFDSPALRAGRLSRLINLNGVPERARRLELRDATPATRTSTNKLGDTMNRNLALLMIATAFALNAGTALADDTTPTPRASPAEQAQMKKDAAAAKANKAAMTSEQKKTAAAQKQHDLDEVLKSCDAYNSGHATAEQTAKMKKDAAAARSANAKMTAAERRAMSAEKQKMMTECMKYGG